MKACLHGKAIVQQRQDVILQHVSNFAVCGCTLCTVKQPPLVLLTENTSIG